jgi:hypothetical protein
MKTNEPKTDAITVPADGYTTNELSVFVSEQLKTDISPKRLRTVLRQLIPDETYTRYRFKTLDSPLTRQIISILKTDLSRRTERKKLAAERKQKRLERKTTFADETYAEPKTKTAGKSKTKTAGKSKTKTAGKSKRTKLKK